MYDGPENYQWWYQEDDGSYPANAWKEINGTWYHFDENGYLDLGWHAIDGKWYLFEDSGAMATSGNWEGGYILPDGSLNRWYVGREYDVEQIMYVDEMTNQPYQVADWKKNIFSAIQDATAELWAGDDDSQTKTYSLDIQVPANWYEEFPSPLMGKLIVQSVYDFRESIYIVKNYSYSTNGTNLHIELTVAPYF